MAAETICRGLSERLQNFDAQPCRDAELAPAKPLSVGKRPLLYRDFPAAAANVAPKRVLILGGIHGDELSSVAVVFQWIELLKSGRYDRYSWRVLPLTNPDGLFARPATRVNARGVDLNRNFPSPQWSSQALSYWKDKTRGDKRRYPGPEAASEPETRWIVEQIEQYQPDAIITVHAPYGVLDFDGPQDPPKKLGYLRLQPLGIYPGSLGDYAGLSLKLPVITLELPQAHLSPSASQSGRIWSDLLVWLDKTIAKQPAAR
ncbi:M14 family zinc carboxypeptidase [Nevskia sp.]|uniref:M14 family zinc carboxypeptidase n=1 Tax=Nevskia sp. TaxID=1929292 RepID=UPI003F6FDF18